MTNSFFAATFSAARADALIGQIQAGMAQAPVGANMALVRADEACGQALIDRVVDWLAQEVGGPVLAIPTVGHEAGQGSEEQACIQVLWGQGGAARFGPLNDWSFDALARDMSVGLDPAKGIGTGVRLIALDPRTPFFAQRLNWLHEAGEAPLIGALTAPSGAYTGPCGLSFDFQTPLLAQVFPGVERLAGDWTITAAEGQVVHEIDGRPALDVLREVAGDILARKPEQIPSYISTAFPVSATDPEDFLVRRINGLGQRSGSFSIADEVLPGMPLAFARRNGPHVRAQVEAGVVTLLDRAGELPKAALYLYDSQRARDFSQAESEAELVRRLLPNIPLISGAVQGVVSDNRLYHLASQLIFVL